MKSCDHERHDVNGQKQNVPALYLRVNRANVARVSKHLETSHHWRRFVVPATSLINAPDLLGPFTARLSCETILDPQTAEAASRAFGKSYRGKLPWTPKGRPTKADGMDEKMIVEDAVALAGFAIDRDLDVIMSPAHLLGERGEPWLPVDARACMAIRTALDEAGEARIAVDYTLLAPLARLADPSWREQVLRHLDPLPFRQIWIRAGPFGIGLNADLAALSQAIAAFRSLGRPVILDHAGGLPGLAPLALGHADGICHGVGSQLEADFLEWGLDLPSGTPPPGRRRKIYQPKLDRILTPLEYDALDALPKNKRKEFSCIADGCCPSNQAVIDDPKGHFLRQSERLQRDLLAASPDESRQRFSTHLWEVEQQIKTARNALKKDTLPHQILDEAATHLDLLGKSVKDAAATAGASPPRPGFNGLDPADRPLNLRLSSPSRRRKTPEPEVDLFEDD